MGTCKTTSLLLVITLVVLGASQQLIAQDMALKTNILYDATTTINLGYEVALNHKMTLDIWVNYNPWTLGKKWVGLYESEFPVSEANRISASERNVKLKHLAIQPELRWWLCEKFNGHFFGVHLHGGMFNVGALKLPFNWGRYQYADGNFLGTYPVTMTSLTNTNVKVQGIAYHVSETGYNGLGATDGAGEVIKGERNDIYWGYADRDGIYVNSFEGWFAGAGISYGYHLIVSPRFSMEFTVGAGYVYLKYDKNRCTDCTKKLGEEISHYFGPTRAGLSLIYMLK